MPHTPRPAVGQFKRVRALLSSPSNWLLASPNPFVVFDVCFHTCPCPVNSTWRSQLGQQQSRLGELKFSKGMLVKDAHNWTAFLPLSESVQQTHTTAPTQPGGLNNRGGRCHWCCQCNVPGSSGWLHAAIFYLSLWLGHQLTPKFTCTGRV